MTSKEDEKKIKLEKVPASTVVISVLILISMIYGVMVIPFRTYPEPFATFENVLLIGLLGVYVFKAKLPPRFVTSAKYFWWLILALSFLYVQYLAVIGTVDLGKVVQGDIFIVLVPVVLLAILRKAQLWRVNK